MRLNRTVNHLRYSSSAINGSKPRNHRPLELGLDELADFFGVVGLDQLGHPRFALILLTHSDQVHIRALGAFLGDGILGRAQAR